MFSITNLSISYGKVTLTPSMFVNILLDGVSSYVAFQRMVLKIFILNIKLGIINEQPPNHNKDL